MSVPSGLLRFAMALVFLTPRSATVLAYQQRLDGAALHDAYILGQRNDAATAAFLSAYLKEFTTESQGTIHVTQIQVLTPFAQVVDHSRQNTAGYSEEQARNDYQKSPDIVAFNITLMLPAAYQAAKENPAAASDAAESAGQTAEDFWQRFDFRVKQEQKLLPLHSLHGQPIYSTATATQPAVLDGANVWLEYEAKDVASIETLIEVGTPDGHTVSVSFDLKKLR
jgi:hypothetical protein